MKNSATEDNLHIRQSYDQIPVIHTLISNELHKISGAAIPPPDVTLIPPSPYTWLGEWLGSDGRQDFTLGLRISGAVAGTLPSGSGYGPGWKIGAAIASMSLYTPEHIRDSMKR